VIVRRWAAAQTRPARSQAEGRARDLLGHFPLYSEIEL